MHFWDKLSQVFGNQKEYSHTIDYTAVEQLIGYQFRDRALLTLSLTHRSHAYVSDTYPISNERLEFLGDSVLGLIIADQLFRDYPQYREGQLTKMKALLVSETTLAAVAIRSGLNEHLLLAPEEDRSGGRERPSIVSDAFESVIGAAYLDGGLDASRDVVMRMIYAYRDEITSDSSRRNFKGELLEYIQSQGGGMPKYDVLSEVGPDHDKVFTVEVLVAGEKVGTGSGHSKKEAEQHAASVALAYLQKK